MIVPVSADFTVAANVARGGSNGHDWADATGPPLPPDGILLPDGVGTETAAGAGYSNYIQLTFPSISLPSNATILGIQINAFGYSVGGANATDSAVYLLKGGTIQTGTNKADAVVWPTSPPAFPPFIKFYGGSSDLWGLSWTASDFGSGFGVAISINAPNSIFDFGYVSLTVYFLGAGDITMLRIPPCGGF